MISGTSSISFGQALRSGTQPFYVFFTIYLIFNQYDFIYSQLNEKEHKQDTV